MAMENSFYITTPIYYVNGVPHIGHAYTTIAADTISRYKKMNGYDVFFATGTDEHGQKIFKAAEEKQMDTQEFVDSIVIKFKELWENLNLDYTGFIRTTDQRHKDTVICFLNTLYEKGDIYKGEYEGLYCVPCESFFTELQAKDGICPDCGRKVEVLKETSYFFKLSKYQDWLISYIKENNLVTPVSKQNEILSFLSNKLEDLCISRSKSRLAWGIPIPFDTEHVTYVWFDALINYISILNWNNDKDFFNKYWPCDFHLIGKDILRPHSVYWTIMLKAMDIPLPKKIFAHGWWKIEGEKMSKSKGNAVDPNSLIQEFGLDSFRYFLLREVPFGGDGSFSRTKIITRINNELANDLGNLVSRATGMLSKYTDSILPEFNIDFKNNFDKELSELLKETFVNLKNAMDKLEFNNSLQIIWKYIVRINRYIEETAPWKLAKDETKKQELENVMYNIFNAINYISILIYPFMPVSSNKIRVQLSLSENFIKEFKQDFDDYLEKQKIKTGIKVIKGSSLFPKIEIDKEIK